MKFCYCLSEATLNEIDPWAISSSRIEMDLIKQHGYSNQRGISVVNNFACPE